ncbi:MAG: DUF2304 domain-containing protein [Eubacterium sp.]|nr:DUF2304 domain-containing protein [Eubacterium sp.]
MSIRLQIIVIACMLFAIIYIAVRLRKKTLSYKFGIWWIMIFVIISIFAIFPRLLAAVSDLMGIKTPANTLMLFGFMLALLIMFYQTVELSRQSEQLKNLAQEMALFKKKMHDELNRIDKSANSDNNDEA